jgi:hypothetical protein
MRMPFVAALPFALCSCASSPAPALPPPPDDATRARWHTVAVEVDAVPDALVVDGPPTTVLGRVGTGAYNGALGGAVVCGVVPNAALLLMPVGFVVGGVGGALVGPLLGDDGDVVAARTAAMADTIRDIAPSALRASLEHELRVRGATIGPGGVVCRVRLDELGLAGEPGFDPDLEPVVRGELTMHEASGAAVFTLPFHWHVPSRSYGAWHRNAQALQRSFAVGAGELAAFLADELLCTVATAWTEVSS